VSFSATDTFDHAGGPVESLHVRRRRGRSEFDFNGPQFASDVEHKVNLVAVGSSEKVRLEQLAH